MCIFLRGMRQAFSYVGKIFRPVGILSAVPDIPQEGSTAEVPGSQLRDELRNDAAQGYHLFVDDAVVAGIFQILVGKVMLVALLGYAIEDRTEEDVAENCFFLRCCYIPESMARA